MRSTATENTLMDYLRQEGGRSHGLMRNSQIIGEMIWESRDYLGSTIGRAEETGRVRVEPCTHGTPQLFDVVLIEEEALP